MMIRRRTRFVLGAMCAALCLATSLSAASAQEQQIPVMVQTVPGIQGIELTLDGTSFYPDQNGLALITVSQSGTYELGISTSDVADGVRHSFVRWSDGPSSQVRDVTVDSFTVLEAGFDTSYATAFSTVSPDGSPAEGGVERVTIRAYGGRKLTLEAGSETWLTAERVVAASGGLSSRPIDYEVEAIDDRPVPAGESEPFRLDADGTLTIEIDEPAVSAPRPAAAPAGAQEPASERALGAWILAATLLMVAAGAIVLGRARVRRVLRRLSIPRPAAALERAMGATDEWRSRREARRISVAGRRDAPPPDPAARTHVRVMLEGGRVIEGFRDASGIDSTDEFLCLIHVTRVLDESSKEVRSSPMDAFIPSSRIIRIEPVEDPASPVLTVDLRANGRTHVFHR